MPPDRFTGTNPDPVDAGKNLNIVFTNQGLANQTITVSISNGDGSTDTVTIKLDADGKGSTTWKVPAAGWDGVILSEATSSDHVVAVN